MLDKLGGMNNLICNRYFVLFSVVVIYLVGLIPYSNTFRSALVFDDWNNIIHNQDIKSLSNLPIVWHNRPSRFIANLSFALNFAVGKYNVFGYHLVNTTIHLLNAVVLFFLIGQIQKIKIIKHNSVLKSKWFPLVSSLLFVSHPIQTQAVTFITQRMASLATLFYLSSILFYLKAGNLKGVVRDRVLYMRSYVFYYFISILFLILALLTKENTYTLPLALLLVEYYFFSPGLVRIKKRLLRFLPYFFIAVALYYISFISSSGNPLFQQMERVSSMTQNMAINRYEYILTQINVVRTYIRLLFLPVGQNIDHDYPVSRSFFETTTMLSFLFLLTLISFAVYAFRKFRLVSFGILFFFLTLSVESSFIPIADVIFEHRLYLPSVGFVIAVGAAIFYFYHYLYTAISKRNKYRLWHFKIIFCLIFFLTITSGVYATYQRNKIWNSEYTLWSDAVEKSSNKPRVHYNLGVALGDKGKYELAKKEFEKAIYLNPGYTNAYYNLGAIYERQGKYDDALKFYLTALALDESNMDIRSSLGSFYVDRGEYEKAIVEYNIILQNEPDNTEVYSQLKDLLNNTTSEVE